MDARQRGLVEALSPRILSSRFACVFFDPSAPM